MVLLKEAETGQAVGYWGKEMIAEAFVTARHPF